MNRQPTDTVIYEGIQMTREEANAKQDAAQVHQQDTYFDPLDLVENTNAYLKYEVLSGMAWRLDNTCIATARSLFFGMRTARHDTIDDFNEFINEVAELKANESYNVDLGFEENAGLLQSLSMLLVLRKHWHDHAEMAGVVIGAKYAPKTLEELVDSEKKQELRGDDAIKLEMLAKIATRKHPDRYDQVLTTLKQREAQRAERTFETRKLTAPAVKSIFCVAEYRGGDDVAFHQLSDELRARLLLQTKGAFELAVERLATRKAVTTVAYAVATVEAFDAMDRLDAVIAKLV